MEIMVTVVPLVALWLVLWSLLQVGTVLSSVAFLLLLVPAGGLMVRLFILQHDCGHGSMFRSKFANDWVG
ncbi:MAG: omega-6 fatty acid desaturase (delta-12 desaturase), partial [Granulosicoccus sp.]